MLICKTPRLKDNSISVVGMKLDVMKHKDASEYKWVALKPEAAVRCFESSAIGESGVGSVASGTVGGRYLGLGARQVSQDGIKVEWVE
jgi:hypothetical protein